MWIMITKRIPTDPSPPKMAIFWSELWGHSKKDIERYEKTDNGWDGFGFVDDRRKSMRVEYEGTNIRILDGEYSIVAPERMRIYLGLEDGMDEEDGSHYLVPCSVSDKMIQREIRKGSKGVLMEAAMLDGCNKIQAKMVANGIDVTEPDYEIPPLGYYMVKEHYADLFTR